MDRYGSPGERAHPASAKRRVYGRKLPQSLRDEVARHLPDFEAEEVVGIVLEGIQMLLGKSGVLRLRKLGTFHLHRQERRIGVNPHTGERITVPASCEIHFTADQSLEATL